MAGHNKWSIGASRARLDQNRSQLFLLQGEHSRVALIQTYPRCDRENSGLKKPTHSLTTSAACRIRCTAIRAHCDRVTNRCSTSRLAPETREAQVATGAKTGDREIEQTAHKKAASKKADEAPLRRHSELGLDGASAPESAPVVEARPADDTKPAPELAPTAPVAAPTAAPIAAETEWRPSAKSEPPAATDLPTASVPTASPAPAAAAPAPVDPVVPVVKPRPVYIPRHVAKQMEEQARLSGDPNPIVPVPMPASEARESVPAVPVQEEELGEAEGIVEVSGKGFGFLRPSAASASTQRRFVRRYRSYGLRDGQWSGRDAARQRRSHSTASRRNQRRLAAEFRFLRPPSGRSPSSARSSGSNLRPTPDRAHHPRHRRHVPHRQRPARSSSPAAHYRQTPRCPAHIADAVVSCIPTSNSSSSRR